VCVLFRLIGIVIGRVGSAIDRGGCIMESGCSDGKGCDCVVVVIIFVVGSINPGGEGWTMALVAGEKRVVTLLSLSSLLLLLPALLSQGRAVWNALVVVQQWRW